LRIVGALHGLLKVRWEIADKPFPVAEAVFTLAKPLPGDT